MDDMFLEIPKKICGEYDAHPNKPGEKERPETDLEIQILNWKWDIKNPANIRMSHQEASSKAEVGNVFIQKAPDLASVTLMQYCLLGTHIEEAKIVCRKQNGDEKIDFYIIKLMDVMVKSINQSLGTPDLSPEVVELNFGKFRVEYTKQKNTGVRGPTKRYGWNVTEHTPLE